ncbi:hypothetical protein J6590_093330, partial [Homalodisca vitripennis]
KTGASGDEYLCEERRWAYRRHLTPPEARRCSDIYNFNGDMFRLISDAVSELTPGIWSHVRLKRSKKSRRRETLNESFISIRPETPIMIATISKHGGATEFSTPNVALEEGLVQLNFEFSSSSPSSYCSFWYLALLGTRYISTSWLKKQCDFQVKRSDQNILGLRRNANGFGRKGQGEVCLSV